MVQQLAADIGMADRVTSRPEDFMRYGFGPEACFEALIAERDGEPLGLCLYFFSFSSWAGRRGVYVQDIFVSRDARGSGLGRRLLAETARRAAQQGAVFLRLAVDRENRPARQFYRLMGMEHADHDCIYKAWDESFEQLMNADRADRENPA